MNNNYEEVSGSVENVVYRNEVNDYTVIEVLDESSTLVTAVGTMSAVCEGERVKLSGYYTFHKEFGRQFVFESYEKSLPKEADGMIQYLSSGAVKGVGPITALKIVNKFGTEAFDVIENHPEWLVDIQGITAKKARAISDSFKAQFQMRDVVMLCSGHFSPEEISALYKELGAGARGIIVDNPYILCDGPDPISFLRVDPFAKTLDIPSRHEGRIFYGMRHVLMHNASLNGHTCLPVDMLIEQSSALLGVERDYLSEMLESFLELGRLSRYETDDGARVMLRETADAEDFIAKRICQLDRQVRRFGVNETASLLEKIELKFGISYAKLQKEAIYEALSSGAMVLTGGPGTGKTTVVKALVSIFESLGMKYVLAAPTGRAAKRLSEATSCPAKTIHRLLESEKVGRYKTSFARSTRFPLDEEVVIIDEASMLDLNIAYSLFQAMRRFSRIILIGDVDQLPSVGAGNVLGDIIASGVIKEVRLNDIFRQSSESAIIVNAHRINKGESPMLNVVDNDFFFVRRENERDIPETIASLILERLPKKYGADIKNRIQVIAPSKKGIAGVEELNALLQQRINPPVRGKTEYVFRGKTFRDGDKVMQNVNNYDLEWQRGRENGFGIFNGEIGVISKVDVAREKLTILFDDKVVDYPFKHLEELEHSYAITVHKSQGSEYPVIIIPMYNCPVMLMTRNLLYTAVTRAKSMVILVGRSDVPDRMAQNDRKIHRYTTLTEKICAEK